jgi:hypothetical protein
MSGEYVRVLNDSLVAYLTIHLENNGRFSWTLSDLAEIRNGNYQIQVLSVGTTLKGSVRK